MNHCPSCKDEESKCLKDGCGHCCNCGRYLNATGARKFYAMSDIQQALLRAIKKLKDNKATTARELHTTIIDEFKKIPSYDGNLIPNSSEKAN